MAEYEAILDALIGEVYLKDGASPADQEALQALRGAIDKPGQVLARYVRESLFLHPVVRRHLADALQGGTVYGTRLTFSGGGGRRDHSRAIAAREKWLKK